MEHILQFAIGIDDDKIREEVESNASNQIVKQIKQDITNKIFSSRIYKGNASAIEDPLSQMSKDIVRDFLNENRDRIISLASKELAERILKSKASKALIENHGIY